MRDEKCRYTERAILNGEDSASWLSPFADI